MAFDSLSVSELTAECKRQSQRYRHQLSRELHYCLELFRRAFEEKDDDACSALYDIYLGLVHHWVRSHPSFPNLDKPLEFVVVDSIGNFFLAMRKQMDWQYNSVIALLSYWKKCVNSVIVDELRKKQVTTISLDNVTNAKMTPDMDRNLNAAEIWHQVEKVITDEKERLLARLIFLQDLKPAQIVAHHSNIWPDAQAIRIDRQRIKRRLFNDSTLRQFLDRIENQP